jgi:phosphocarrier protein
MDGLIPWEDPLVNPVVPVELKGIEPMKIIEPIPIFNRLGLHLRAGAELVRVACKFQCQIRVSHGGRSVNSKSLIQLLTLGAIYGTVLEFSAEGEDAPQAIDAIRKLLRTWAEPEIEA